MIIHHSDSIKYKFSAESLFFQSFFLNPYFKHFDVKNSGLIEMENGVLIPFQLINQNISGLRKTESGNMLHRCFGKNALNFLEQLFYNSDKSIRVLLLGNIFITGSYGFSSHDSKDIIGIFKKDFFKKLFKHFDNAEMIMLKDAKPTMVDQLRDWIEMPVLPEMKMKIPVNWDIFEDYLNALSSKYRVRSKSALSKLKNVEVVELQFEDVLKYQNEINVLYQQVYQKAEFKILPISDQFILELKKEMGDKFIITAFFYEGRIIAFNTFIFDRQIAHANMIGMEYSLNETFKLYQNILLHLVASSIKYKAQVLNFGRTAMEIKSAVGASPDPSFCFVRFRSKTQQMLFKKMIKTYQLPDWKQRKPFKSLVSAILPVSEEV